VRGRHDFGEAGPPEDAVVWAFEVDHLEGDFFLAEVSLVAKRYVERDSTERVRLATRHYAMEGGDGGLQHHVGKARALEGAIVQDVDAIPTSINVLLS
ncbi:hypothetical protein JBE27_55025, partial [Streptomyces albiflaviniger]|nr:hypothetical protein [Streptomyces albiflaviniger]